jgi:hypothetical protein
LMQVVRACLSWCVSFHGMAFPGHANLSVDSAGTSAYEARVSVSDTPDRDAVPSDLSLAFWQLSSSSACS